MFIAALLMIAKYLKQPRCSSTSKWINKLYMYIQCNTTQTKINWFLQQHGRILNAFCEWKKNESKMATSWGDVREFLGCRNCYVVVWYITLTIDQNLQNCTPQRMDSLYIHFWKSTRKWGGVGTWGKRWNADCDKSI